MDSYEYLRKIVEDIVKEKLLGNISTTLLKEKRSGLGYMCDIIKIAATEGSNTIKIVVKVSTRNDKFRANVPIDEAFNNELLFYEKIYPAMQKLQEELKILLFDSVPTYFRSGEYEDQSYLFMEDLTNSGYKTLGVKKEMGHDHIKIICEIFGKFHALSFALKHLKPEIYNDFVTQFQSLEFGFNRHKGGIVKWCISAIQENLRNSNCSHDMIDHYADNFIDIHKNIWLSSQKEEYSCIIHYDGWPNNFMFKYDVTNGTETIKDVKLIDWQNCRIGPPALDLSIALYTIASNAVLNNLEEYLKIYYKTFEIFLCQTGLKAEDVYPFDVLKEQWKKYCQYGLFRGLVVYKQKMNIEQSVGSFKEAMDSKIDVMKMQKILTDIFEHFKLLGVF